MKHPAPPGNQAQQATSSFEMESHVIYGQEVSSTSSHSSSSEAGGGDSSGWMFATKGPSWHVWTYRTLFDNVGLPLWPQVMDEVRIIVSTEMCRRHKEQQHLPCAPFMPPSELEYCGIHVSATARTGEENGNEGHDDSMAGDARGTMRQWVAVFLGWTNADPANDDPNHATPLETAVYGGAPGPDAFVDIGTTSIYYFHPFADRLIDTNSGPAAAAKPLLLSLAKLAIGAHHPLHDLVSPHVTHEGKRWLDNRRMEVRLRRTHQGFVEIKAQVVSLLHPADRIAIVPAENATSSSVTWIGPTGDSPAFTLSKSDPKPRVIRVPDSFYAQHGTTPPLSSSTGGDGGSVVARTRDFRSFHPWIQITAQASPQSTPHLATEQCRVETIQFLPRTYFFDPYQLDGIAQEDSVGAMNRTQHYGPIELELPAESMPNWGSILVVSQAPHTGTLDIEIPIHARYRLPVARVHEQTVGYNGEPTGDSHIEVTLLPPLCAVVCPSAEARAGVKRKPLGGSSVFDDLDDAGQPALFHELGLAPVSVLGAAPDCDLLLRMPVGKAEHALVVQALTLATLLAGTAFIVYSVRRKARKEGKVVQAKSEKH
ncbi:protease B nonderepressible form [Coemansia sp. RSA 1200]|nr:protease B nonderepressible form [Coemansia sp. RSA 1200]